MFFYFLDYVHEQEIAEVISKMKNSNSCGLDCISSKTLKNIYPKILKVLAYIINLSFSTGIFPEQLKIAVVTPVFKKGSRLDPNCYRPISLLSTLSKVFEKIMKKRLVSFFDKTQFISDNQYGFRSGMSTETALIDFMKNISDKINIGNKVTGIFIDIKKAFDSVNHKILLEKLYNCGIRGRAQNWFKSYLSNRKQCVKIKTCFSAMGNLNIGVPQGSVLGANLFLVFINDLCSARFKGNVSSFTDVTALSYYNSSLQLNENYMASDLKSLKWWFSKNKMILSPEKTVYVNFALRLKPQFQGKIIYPCINCLCNSQSQGCTINCSELSEDDKVKYLGLILDNKLNWKEQIKSIKGRLNNIIRTTYFLRDLCDFTTLKTIYYSLFQSRLEYSLVCWGGTYLSNIDPLIKQQKHIIRIITRNKVWCPSWPLFLQNKILPLRHLFVYKVLIIFYKRSGNKLCDERSHNYLLRTTQIFQIPQPYSTFYKKSFEYIGPLLYNKLPECLRKTKSLNLFKRSVKEWLFDFNNIENLLSGIFI